MAEHGCSTMTDPLAKPNLLKKEDVKECDEDGSCRANIRTGRECVNHKTDKEQLNEMDAESVNTDRSGDVRSTLQPLREDQLRSRSS